MSDVDMGMQFRPTESMLKVKARYWQSLQARPLVDGAAHTLALAKQVTQSGSLEGWWRKPGFREWFLNERAIEEKVEWLQELALLAVEDILQNTDPKAQGARLNAAKLVSEMTGRAARAPEDKDAKKRRAIDGMTREQLEEFLAAHGIRIQQVVALDTAAAPTPTKDT